MTQSDLDGGRRGAKPSGTPHPGARGAPISLAVYAAPLVIAAVLFRPAMERGWPGDVYLGLHLVAEMLVAVAAFATFAVQWYAGGARLNDPRARLVGAAFLAVGAFQVVHVLAFPGMPGLPWLGSSTERGIVYWLAARGCAVGGLLAALAVPTRSEARWLRRAPLLAGSAALVAVVLAADYLWISRRPLFFVEGTGLTPLKQALELTVAAGAAFGLAAWRRAAARGSDPGAGELALALGLAALAELCFALYATAYDSFNLLGHLYLLASTGWVFHALFVQAVLLPYERLDASSRALAASNAELERLRAHVEGELAATIRDLRLLQEQREDFLRAVSHDLRTPLQTILLQAERLMRTAPQGTRERSAAEALGRASRRMSGLVGDLVESISLESEALHLAQAPLALGEFLTDLLCAGGEAIEGERFRVDVPPNLPAVSADAARLGRVVQNLAGNALKYSPPGSPIRVEARREADEVVVSIADRGAGVPPEDLPRIFERFYRGGQRGKVEGLGLGLYISRLIVTAHGGRIWCESTLGEGSTFRFALPAGGAPRMDSQPPDP